MGDRAAVIAMEQRAVDHAYACYEQKFAKNRELKNKTWDVTDSEAGTSFIPDVPPEIRYNDDLGGEALVFQRVDVTEVEDEPLRTYYIGRRTVRDSNGDPIVLAWQAHTVNTWQLARPDAPGDVRLRRSLRCEGRLVQDYRDELLIVVPQRDPADAAPETPVPAPEPERMPDFLLDDLERARDGRMRDIVETIRQEQLQLVTDEPKGLLVVQGGPGTGKTAVGLHRVSWLLYNKVFKPEEILVVGPHQGFFTYISRVLPSLDIGGTTMLRFDAVWADQSQRTSRSPGTDTLQAAAVKSDGRMADVLRRAVNNLVRVDALTRLLKDDELKIFFEGVELTIPKEDVRSLVESDDQAIPFQMRRQRFTNALVDRLMHAFVEARRQSLDSALRSRINRHRAVAGLIHSMWPQVTAESVLRSLLGNPETLRAAADGILDQEEQQAIHRPQAARVSEERWSIADQVCLEELRLLMTGDGPPRRYRHIVIDEAQDLTPMQARSLARRCPSGSMTVLGDLAQATGVHPYGRWNELAETLAGPDGWHLEELTVGYRLPDEVMRLAAPLAAYIAPSITFPESIRPEGGNPIRFIQVTASELLDSALSEVLALAAAEAATDRSTALILPDDEDLIEQARSRLAERREDPLGAVQVLSSSETKGLEFDHVVVAEPAAIAREAAGARRLYIAITRCTQSLTIVHEESLPGILTGETEPEQDETVTAEPIPAVEPADEDGKEPTERPNDFEGFVSALEDRVRTERQCHVHERIRHLLIGELYGARLKPTTDLPTIDVSCKTASGTILYEVLGEGGHTYQRMREAVLRIAEVQYAEGIIPNHRFLVLPRSPAESWAADVVGEAFGIWTIWRTDDGWGGHLVPLALGQA
ncbi:HelD family protein [Actinoallomurus rhizosphaericola]|uniref:HelD family protein n=1 Tax=Actinoallomurus rhizosphaericola TaxID=2952536 RepID=UPI0020905E38|nr:UvrD-helicase domain-containing protein [Actinoallomurus rhizosphaericola]MCO5994755.1 AAA family ATPase [Actinoallomurus rhizosphaericola]